LTIGPMPRAGKAPAKPVTRAQPDSSDDEEGDHEHDVREQEELLIACAANIGRETSTDPLVLSERQPPPRPATAPGAHDAGLDYGASAAMTRVPKRKQRIFEPSQNRCPACQRRMYSLLSTGADRCQNPKCPVRFITGGGERSAKKGHDDLQPRARTPPLPIGRC
jgi:hypothetical protein